MAGRIAAALFLIASTLGAQVNSISQMPDATSVIGTDSFFCSQTSHTVINECFASQIAAYVLTLIDTEAEFEAVVGDITNMIIEAEINTEAEIVAIVSDLATILQNTDIDTEAELVAIVTDLADILQTTDIDTEAELEALIGDVTNVWTDNDTLVGADHLDAMPEIAAGIKRGPDATDTHLLTTDVSAPGSADCLEMDTDGSIILSGSDCKEGTSVVDSITLGTAGDNTTYTADFNLIFESTDGFSAPESPAGTRTVNLALPDDFVTPDDVHTTGQTDEYCLTYEATGTTWEWQVCGAGSGDVTDVWDCSTGDCNTLTIGESEYLIGGAVDGSTDPYISLPQGADCSSVTGEGRVCWEDDLDILWVGDGLAAGGSGFGTFGNAIADGIGDDLTISSGIGTSTTTGDDPETMSFKLYWDHTLAEDFSLGARKCVFSNEGTGGFLCAGATGDDDNELLFLMPYADVVAADETWTLAATAGPQTFTGKTYDTPLIDGVMDMDSGSVQDDTCSKKGEWWFDDTGGQDRFEFCEAASGAPSLLGGSPAEDSVGPTQLYDNSDSPLVGQIVTVDPASTSYFAYSAWTIDGSNVLDGPAHATTGGVVTVKEGVDDGTDTFKLKVPDSGLSADKVCTLAADGEFTPDCIESTGQTDGDHLTWNAGGTLSWDAAGAHSNGANCSAGSYPLGVDGSGAIESCTDASTEIDSIVATHTAVTDAHIDHADNLTELNTQISSGLVTGAHFTATAGVSTDHGAASVSALSDLGAMTCTGDQYLARNTGDTAWECVAEGGASSAISAGNSDMTVADAGAGTITATVDASAVGIWNVGGLEIGGADATDTLLLPQSNDAVTPTLAFGDEDSGFYEAADDALHVAIAGASAWLWSGTAFRANTTAGPRLFDATPSGTSPTFVPNGGDLDTGIGWAAADQLSLVAGGVEGFRLTEATTVSAQLSSYGSGAITGTDAYWLAVDSSGNIIEEAAPAAAGANSDITSLAGLTTDLTVAQGGTGAGTFTDGGILIGNGTGAIQALGVATNGQVPMGDGTEDPVLNEIDGTANEIEITNGAGTITVGIVTAPTLDAGNITGIPAGAYDADSIDSDDVAASLNTKSHCITIADPVTDEDWFTVWRAPTAVTLVEIYCEVTGGTSVAFDFQLDDGGPTAVNGGEITCTTSGVTDSSLGGSDVNMADGDRLDVLQGTVTGSVTQASYCIEYTID